jgi:hypothetical protein
MKKYRIYLNKNGSALRLDVQADSVLNAQNSAFVELIIGKDTSYISKDSLVAIVAEESFLSGNKA